MKKHPILLILLAISFFSFAQNRPPSNKELRQKANHSYVVLKENVLLVRLKNNLKKINALKEYGYNLEATDFQYNQNEENKQIIKSFKEEFTFCDTYFFFSEHSNLVRAKVFTEPFFLDDNLKVDTSLSVTTDSFLIAEFAHIVSNHEDGLNKRNSYWARPNMRFGALIVMNNQFVQIRRPFPRYSRTFASLPFFKRPIHKTVARLNKKLFKYGEN